MHDELVLAVDADERARRYLQNIQHRRVFPDDAAIAALREFDEDLPVEGRPDTETLALLDDVGSPATVASNGPNYFGFVVGATLPAAAAAERLVIAWDQAASSFDNSPAAATIERLAGRWVLEALDLPRHSSVGFGTSATACTLSCVTAARRTLLSRAGWNFDEDGLAGAPQIRVVVSETVHITVKKALRILGFGTKQLIVAPVDEFGRIDPARLPALDERTILFLQAGEVNTGDFDRFAEIIPIARAAGAWVHVDGAFGLWARASAKHRHLTDGIQQADSWTTDGHKWLNTPYDAAMAICRHADALAESMNSDAVYATAGRDAQKNLTLEFSRRARGVPVWAALRSLGRNGLAQLVERHCEQAARIGERLREAGFTILNRVVLNQVLVRDDTDEGTIAIREAAQRSGKLWFGQTVWRNRPAFRISLSSWRTTDDHVERAIDLLVSLRESKPASKASPQLV